MQWHRELIFFIENQIMENGHRTQSHTFEFQRDLRLLPADLSLRRDLKDGLGTVAVDVSGERQFEAVAIRDHRPRRAISGENPGVSFASSAGAKGVRRQTERVVLNLYRAHLGGRSRLCLV